MNKNLIDPDAVSKASELIIASHNPELANYFFELLEKKISTYKLQENYKEFLEKQQEFKESVYDVNHGIDRHWQGQDVLSDYQKLQENLSRRQAEVIDAYLSANKQSSLAMHFAFGNNAEFLRAYQIANKNADDNLNNAMDQMVTSWLARNNWMNKDGYICEVNENTNAVKLDSSNNPVRADINKVRAAFNDELTGFKNYLAQKNRNFNEIQLYERKQ
jgi:hypothetical protein